MSSLPGGLLFSIVAMMAVGAFGQEFAFRHHFIAKELPTAKSGTGDYGLTALGDLNHDGHLDFVLGGRQPRPERLYWFEYQAPDRWTQHEVGEGYQSDVGLAAIDVDGDGWIDLVGSGVWYRNPAPPGDKPWERFAFAKNARGAHDVVAADVDGDGRKDVVMMGDGRTPLNALCWFKISADPKQPWDRYDIGPSIHGAIAPNGVVDVDGDGDLDVVRADTWFENKDGKGRAWTPHQNIPMGRKGPYGVCVRTSVADLDGDGKLELVMADADIVESKVAVLKNDDGRGGRWSKVELPQSFSYGSLHSLAVADFNGDRRPDIVVNEQEELLPPGRENPRWVVWLNLGGGRFREQIVLDTKLGGHELQVGDVDGDGDVDICSKPWGCRPWNGLGGKMHVDFLENRLFTPEHPLPGKRSPPHRQ